MYTVNPGEFKYPITIEYPENVVDTDNIPIQQWSIKLKCKAKILNISGKEQILNQGNSFEDVKRFVIRYPKGVVITNKDRILYNGNYYNVEYPSDIQEMHKYLEIVARLII